MERQHPSLILEGGTFRTVYTAGVLDYFLERDFHMPYVLGISAGAISACSYVSKQKERTFRVIANYRNDKRYIGVGNFLKKDRSYFGLDFSYNIIPNQIDYFDWATFTQHEGEVLFGVTNAYTGNVEYMNAKDMDEQNMMLRATCAIPILFPEIKLNGIPYYDGGLSEPIPIKRAMADQYDRHVLVLTQPEGYEKKLDRSSKWVIKLFEKKYPKLAEQMKHRAERYNETIAEINRLEQAGDAFVFRPQYALNSFEKDRFILKRSYDMGYDLAKARFDDLQYFMHSK